MQATGFLSKSGVGSSFRAGFGTPCSGRHPQGGRNPVWGADDGLLTGMSAGLAPLSLTATLGTLGVLATLGALDTLAARACGWTKKKA